MGGFFQKKLLENRKPGEARTENGLRSQKKKRKPKVSMEKIKLSSSGAPFNVESIMMVYKSWYTGDAISSIGIITES